jgi:hypothetical protein
MVGQALVGVKFADGRKISKCCLHFLVSSYVSALKGIKFLFAACKRGKEHHVQNREKFAKFALSNTFLKLAKKESLIAFRAIAKGYKTSFRPYSMRNPRFACNFADKFL